MIDIKFRLMQGDDLPAVLAIEREQEFPWPASLFADALQTPYVSVVLEEAGNIIGFAVMSVVLDECEIQNIVIATARRRCGYGRLLLQHMLQLALEQGAHNVYLEVRASNIVASHLYQRNGFKIDRIRKDYYPTATGREDAIILSCRLLN